MEHELTLWKCHARNFFRSFHQGKETRLTLVGLLGGMFACLMIGFYLAGVYAYQYQAAYNWMSLGLGLALASGFFSGLLPSSGSQSFEALPLTRRALLWDTIAGTLRFPLVFALVLIMPYYLGYSQHGFYTAWEISLAILVVLVATVSTHLLGVTAARIVKTITRHTFIRFLAIISLAIVGLEFFSEPNAITTSLAASFDSITYGELVLVLLGSLGVTGAAVSLIEYLHPADRSTTHHRYWELLTRQRNFRGVFSLGESSFVRHLLLHLRNAKLHLRLAIVFLLYFLFMWIWQQILPAAEAVGFLLMGVAVGLLGFYLSFRSGKKTAVFLQNHQHLPLNTYKQIRGSWAASAVVLLIFAGLVGQYTLESAELAALQQLGLMILAAIGIHNFSFALGFRSSQEEGAYVDQGYGIFLVLASYVLVFITHQSIVILPTAQGWILMMLWALGYSWPLAGLSRASRA